MDLQPIRKLQDDAHPLGVSIVMPCLNEAESLAHCIDNAREALRRIETSYGLAGEIIVADNGSSDGSQTLAAGLGARVVDVSAKGYGAALIGGFNAAFGEYLIMGDADGSYDFTEGVAMVGCLIEGADLCMGSRFDGGIGAGAMPWKNRYIGNPALTGLLNLFFGSAVRDAHCGLRAITKEAFVALELRGSGMEFASEMVIKANLSKLRIAQVPATLSPDLRNRPPHLRPWRDGWRHLRYLLMLSPTWVFGVPAIIAMTVASFVLGVAALYCLGVLQGVSSFGASWTIIAGFLFTVGHLSAIMAIATHFHGVRRGYRKLAPVFQRFGHILTLENALIGGAALIACGLTGLVWVGIYWTSHGYVALPSTLPLVVAAALGSVGMQTILGGFLLAIIADHDANLTPVATR